MSSPKLPAVVLRAAVLAGVLVGIADGLRAAALGHLQLAGLLACVVLTIGFDVLVAAAAGAALALLIAIAGWGRGRGRSSGWLAAGIGWLLAGAASAGAAIGAVTGTANRNNRFLAAGVVVLATFAAAFAAAFVGPALRRALAVLPGLRSKSSERNTESVPSPAGVLVLAPLFALILEAVVFMLVWQTRAPVRKDVLYSRATWAACLSD